MNTDDKYDQLAHAIGEVILAWSYLETIVTDMALHLAQYKDSAYDSSAVSEPLLIVLMHMKMREQILATKALAHAVAEPKDYYDKLAAVLSEIDGPLTIERNRYVHDYWQIQAAGITRFAAGPRVIRPQAFKRELAMGTEKTFEDMAAVRAFKVRLDNTTCSLIALENELATLMVARQTPKG